MTTSRSDAEVLWSVMVELAGGGRGRDLVEMFTPGVIGADHRTGHGRRESTRLRTGCHGDVYSGRVQRTHDLSVGMACFQSDGQ